MNPNNYGYGCEPNNNNMGMGGNGAPGFNFDFSRFNNNPFVTGGTPFSNGGFNLNAGAGGWNPTPYASVVPNPGKPQMQMNNGNGNGAACPVHFQTLDWGKALGGGNGNSNSPSHRGDAGGMLQPMQMSYGGVNGGGQQMYGGQLASPYNSGNVKLISVTPTGGQQQQQQQMGQRFY